MSHDDTGGLLEAMVSDCRPAPTQPDTPPIPGSPFDALAALHAAITGADATDDAELAGLHQQRQDQYCTAVNDAIAIGNSE